MSTIIIKVLCTIGFLALCIAMSKLGNNSFSLKSLNRMFNPAYYLIYIFRSSFVFFITFAQFCLYTLSFHYSILLYTMGAILISGVVCFLLISLAGLTVKERYEKVQKIAFAKVLLSTMTNSFKANITKIIGLIMMVAWLAVTILFWIYPLRHGTVVAWTGVLVYIPYIVAYMMMFTVINSYLVSENIDDDLRNFQLITSFGSISVLLAVFVIPYVIVRVILGNETFPLPSLWWFILIPFGLFILFVLFPYFIGVRKYTSQVTNNNEWLVGWMKESLNVLNFSNTDAQLKESNEKIQVLDDRIKEKSEDADTRLYLRLLNNPPPLVKDFFNKNSEKLRRWDTNISYIEKLEELRDNFTYPDKTNLKEYLKVNIEQYKEPETKKNVYIGILVAAVSGAATFIYKVYETEINNYFKAFFG